MTKRSASFRPTRALLCQAQQKLSANGAIFLEIGWQQGMVARELAATYFPAAQIAVLPDLAGHDRIVTITQPGGEDIGSSTVVRRHK